MKEYGIVEESFQLTFTAPPNSYLNKRIHSHSSKFNHHSKWLKMTKAAKKEAKKQICTSFNNQPAKLVMREIALTSSLFHVRAYGVWLIVIIRMIVPYLLHWYYEN